MNSKKEKTVIVLLLGILLLNGLTSAVAVSEKITINKANVKQGGLIKVTVPYDLKEGQVLFAGNDYDFKTEKNKAVTLVPVSYWLETKRYKLSVVNKEKQVLKKWSINVQDGDFDKSYLKVDKENQEKVKPTDPKRQKRRKQDKKLVYQARIASSSERLWTKSFIRPIAKGRVSTGFGATRYHNGNLANRHSGIDIAVPAGTPIKATNAGKVVLADDLLATGNTIIIDHGWNIFSSYLHCSELKVKRGDKVEQGAVIGLVGDTGFSTGPHLHWSMSIGRTFINPADFIRLKL